MVPTSGHGQETGRGMFTIASGGDDDDDDEEEEEEDNKQDEVVFYRNPMNPRAFIASDTGRNAH